MSFDELGGDGGGRERSRDVARATDDARLAAGLVRGNHVPVTANGDRRAVEDVEDATQPPDTFPVKKDLLCEVNIADYGARVVEGSATMIGGLAKGQRYDMVENDPVGSDVMKKCTLIGHPRMGSTGPI